MNPFERWTARQAATHPFIAGTPFTGKLCDCPTTFPCVEYHNLNLNICAGPFTPLIDPKTNERKLAYLVHTQCTQGNITHAQALGLGLAQASPTGTESSVFLLLFFI